MFYDFLRESDGTQTLGSFDHERWNMYFRKHARYRTVCQECLALIEDKYRKLKKKKRLLDACQDDDMQLLLMNDRKKEKWKKLCQQRSVNAKMCISYWVRMAKYNLHPEILERDMMKDAEQGEDELDEQDTQLREY